MRSKPRVLLTCLLVCLLLLVPASPAFAALSRAQVMTRAEIWVNREIPYSQTGWADAAGDIVNSSKAGWRRDCSGFASMAWALPVPGQSTRTFKYVSEPTSKAALQPGDILVSYNNHAVVFGGWANPEWTKYYAYEMSSSASRNSTPTPDGTIIRITPYPYWGYDQSYVPMRLPGITGNVDYTGLITPVEGTNRYRTAVAASKTAFPDGSSAAVIVASGENWPDALGASALAGALACPVLLTKSESAPSELIAEIKRLGAREIIIVGGTPAVSADVEDALALAVSGSEVRRLGGDSRYSTARMLAEEAARAGGASAGTTVFIATGANFPDALAASPISYAAKRPIILTRPDLLSPEAVEAIRAVGAREAVILGAPSAISTAVEDELKALLGADRVTRIAGADRYATAHAVAMYGRGTQGLSVTDAAVATGANFPDALAGGAMAGKLGTVLFLTPPNLLDAQVTETLIANRAAIGKPRCLGSTEALGGIVREGLGLLATSGQPPQP
jgi:putative cell wall-binding protein